MSDAPITLFMPLGQDRSNAGLTIRGETIDEVNAVLADLSTEFEESSKLDELLSGVDTVRAAVLIKFPATTQVTKPAAVTHPQAQSSPSDAPACTHGTMKWKEGTNAKGKWKGWFCPQPYGQEQCKPQFVK